MRCPTVAVAAAAATTVVVFVFVAVVVAYYILVFIITILGFVYTIFMNFMNDIGFRKHNVAAKPHDKRCDGNTQNTER